MAQSSSLIDQMITELTAQETIVGQQTRGLTYMINDPMSTGLKDEQQDALNDRQQRLTLLQNAIGALHALQADGYPTLEIFPLTTELQSEQTGQVSDIEAGASVFGPETAAAIAVIDPGQATDKVS